MQHVKSKIKRKSRYRPDAYLVYWRINATGDTSNKMQIHMQDEENALSHANRATVRHKQGEKVSKADSALALILG